MYSQLPLVFIPGLFGSFGEDILPGAGKLGFGPAGLLYKSFIESLEQMGYVENENLFICYYNWKETCGCIIEKYLEEKILQAKSKTGSAKVDIIAYSMGGLISRGYICSKNYKNDVNKLILLGTPNSGVIDAYYAWAEGKIPDRKDFISFFGYLLLEGYFNILKYLKKFESAQELVHSEFKSIKEILPSFAFGKYLYYLDHQQIMRYISYENMIFKNAYLDGLNSNFSVFRKKDVECYLIAGSGFATGKSYQADDIIFSENGDMLNTGKISGRLQTYEGDGAVLTKSALEMVGLKYVLYSTHDGLLQSSFNLIRQILLGDYSEHEMSLPKEKQYVGVLILGKGRIFMDYNNRKYNLKKHFQMKDLYYYGFKEVRWVIVEKNDKNKIIISCDPRHSDNVEIVVSRENNTERIVSNGSSDDDIRIII